jgi:tripartite-type tricarboxylate transporter receptor subunit TctC
VGVAALGLALAACASPGPAETPSETPTNSTPVEATSAVDFPTKPIKIIIGAGTGGAADLIFRMMAVEMTQILGQQVIVENVTPHAVAWTQTYNAPADGYTIAYLSPPGDYLAQLSGTLGDIKSSDFHMIGVANVDPIAIGVAADSPYQTLEELNEAAKTGEVTIGSTGYASLDGVFFVLYQEAMGPEYNFTQVPYTSGAELTAAVMGRTVDAGNRAGGWYDQHPDNIRILAVASEERSPVLPDVPTVEEVIGKPLTLSSNRGLGVLVGTPPEVVKILEDAFAEAANRPSIKDELLKATGFNWEYLAPDEANAARVASEGKVDAVSGSIQFGG